MLLDLLHQNEQRIAQAGPNAIKKALEAGVPVYYVDKTVGDGIVKEMPDGVRFIIELRDGAEIVIATVARR